MAGGSLADCLAALRRRGEDHSDVLPNRPSSAPPASNPASDQTPPATVLNPPEGASNMAPLGQQAARDTRARGRLDNAPPNFIETNTQPGERRSASVDGVKMIEQIQLSSDEP